MLDSSSFFWKFSSRERAAQKNDENWLGLSLKEILLGTFVVWFFLADLSCNLRFFFPIPFVWNTTFWGNGNGKTAFICIRWWVGSWSTPARWWWRPPPSKVQKSIWNLLSLLILFRGLTAWLLVLVLTVVGSPFLGNFSTSSGPLHDGNIFEDNTPV